MKKQETTATFDGYDIRKAYKAKKPTELQAVLMKLARELIPCCGDAIAEIELTTENLSPDRGCYSDYYVARIQISSEGETEVTYSLVKNLTFRLSDMADNSFVSEEVVKLVETLKELTASQK